MGLIRTDKKYDNLITFGCSFTGGHHLGEEGSWGYVLSNLLGCYHVNKWGGGSNTNIFTNIINYCENNDMSNSCIGIQWSELTRREFWEDRWNAYDTLGLGTLIEHPEITDGNKKMNFMIENLEFFVSIWFSLPENTLRTVQAMIGAKHYLENKGIDFIMFEGINSIKTVKIDDYKYDKSQIGDTGLLSKKIRNEILEDITFFNTLGDWNTAMNKHPEFDPKINDGHPHMEIINWWVNEMYEYIKQNENKM